MRPQPVRSSEVRLGEFSGPRHTLASVPGYALSRVRRPGVPASVESETLPTRSHHACARR
eukprot:2017334-Rhodomonas_salina.2